MNKQALDIPADVRELVEKSVDQTEKAFAFFFQAAKAPPGDIALTLAQHNMKTAFEYARKLARAETFQETIALQAEFFRIQIEQASEFMRELTPKG